MLVYLMGAARTGGSRAGRIAVNALGRGQVAVIAGVGAAKYHGGHELDAGVHILGYLAQQAVADAVGNRNGGGVVALDKPYADIIGQDGLEVGHQVL